MNLTKYWHVGKINLINSLAYRMDVLAQSLFFGLIIYIFINLWKVIYSGNQVIEGFTIAMMIWYLVMTESIVTSPGRLMEEIGNEIQSGDIAQKLNKPYNYVLFHYASSLAKSMFRFGITFFIAGMIAYIFVGGFPVFWAGLPLIAITVFLALSLHFLMSAFLGVFVLWLEDAKALNFIYNKIVFVLGGMLLPLEIFPDWLARIGKALPFSYVAYFPAKLWVMFSWELLLEVIVGQIMWIIILIFLTVIAYKISFRRISINGG